MALPTTREQVQAIVRRCRQHGVAITARGRGTNTTGASVPVRGGLVLGFERMNRVLAIRPGDRVAVVEPGVLNGDLQALLREHGPVLAAGPDQRAVLQHRRQPRLQCRRPRAR